MTTSDTTFREWLRTAEIEFDHYYKYTFTFVGKRDGVVIRCVRLPDDSNNYKYEVSKGMRPVGNWEDEFHQVSITPPDGPTTVVYEEEP